jgi:hypothetical protein
MSVTAILKTRTESGDMIIMKKAASVVLAAVMICGLCVAVSAAGYSYYAVSGIIYDDGRAVIERVEKVDGIEDSAQGGGEDYAIVAEDYDFNTIDSKAFTVKFTGYPDGIGTVSAVPFTVLIPYNDEIYSFSLRDSYNEILSEIEIDNKLDVSDFTVKQNDGGFSLSWRGAEGLTYDITAVSEKSGQRTVLMYRSEETKVEIPFAWLEPNDTVIFELTAQSGSGTAVLSSERFNTPEGAAAVIADADGGEGAGYADNSGRTRDSNGSVTEGNMVDALVITIAIVGGVIVLAIIVAVIIVVRAIKKKNEK